MKPFRKIKIRGKFWSVIYGRPPRNQCDALCQPIERKIWIRPSRNKTRRLQRSSMIHEILHASLYDLSEEAILEVEDAIMNGLDLLYED